MTSPLLPHFFHKYKFYLTIFCCFHILCSSAVHLQTDCVMCVIFYVDKKWEVLKWLLFFFCLFVCEDLTSTQRLYNILLSILCFLQVCPVAAILILCSAISGCTGWKLYTYKQYEMNTRNINFAQKIFQIAAFEINSYNHKILH